MEVDCELSLGATGIHNSNYLASNPQLFVPLSRPIPYKVALTRISSWQLSRHYPSADRVLKRFPRAVGVYFVFLPPVIRYPSSRQRGLVSPLWTRINICDSRMLACSRTPHEGGLSSPSFTIHCVALMHMLFLDSQSPYLELLTAGGAAELMRSRP